MKKAQKESPKTFHFKETSLYEIHCSDCLDGLNHYDPTGLLVDIHIRAVSKNIFFYFLMILFFCRDIDLEENFFSSLCQGL